jgi:hypothetical protein
MVVVTDATASRAGHQPGVHQKINVGKRFHGIQPDVSQEHRIQPNDNETASSENKTALLSRKKSFRLRFIKTIILSAPFP